MNEFHQNDNVDDYGWTNVKRTSEKERERKSLT